MGYLYGAKKKLTGFRDPCFDLSIFCTTPSPASEYGFWGKYGANITHPPCYLLFRKYAHYIAQASLHYVSQGVIALQTLKVLERENIFLNIFDPRQHY